MFPKLNGRTDKRAKIKCTVSYKYIQSTKYSSIITICGVICPLLVIAVFLHMPLIGKMKTHDLVFPTCHRSAQAHTSCKKKKTHNTKEILSLRQL